MIDSSGHKNNQKRQKGRCQIEAEIMELISTDDYFILQHLQRSETSLWVCRKTGKFSVRPPWDLCDQENPECLGLVWGIYGKLDIHPDVCQRLVLVKGKLKLPCFLIIIYLG